MNYKPSQNPLHVTDRYLRVWKPCNETRTPYKFKKN